ncbi:MAG: hypothetical protein K6E59_01840 [Bacilli bacterium]|nr:hypothetical protein [Bacilli bacterium]
MRRFISYLLLCGATLLGVGAATVPTLLKLDADLAYDAGQTLYFRASEWNENSLNGNYTGENGAFLTYDDGLPAGAKQPIAYIADTIRDRLDAYGISGYKVATQGSDTVAVTLRTPKDSQTQYTYLESYLSFSGGNYELDATLDANDAAEGYAYNQLWADIIDGQTARIEDMEQGQYNVPTVVIPLKSGDDYKTAFLDLVKFCKDNTNEADEQSGTEAKSTNLVVWANRLEDDYYKYASANPNVGSKILSVVNPDNAVWYDSSDTDQAYPSLRLIPSSSATSGSQYDPTKTQEAYDAARTLMLTFNAGSFQYDALKASSSASAPRFAVHFAYSEKSPATVESLFVNGDWNRSVAMSATLISTLVVIAALAVLLGFFERALAPLHLAVVGVTGFSALAVFIAFGAQFNIAALIGLSCSALVALFGSLFYSSRLKDELHKGRTLKKAHAEATRKALWPTIDMGIVSVVVGLCVYGLGGDVASKAGVMLVLGGFFGLIANLLYARIAGWLLCNDSTLAEKFHKYLGVRQENIPDLAKMEKQTYFGPFADRDFTRGKFISLIATGLFVLAGIGATIGFGVANKGSSFFNSNGYEASSPVLRIDVRSSEADNITISSLRETSDLSDVNFKEGDAPEDIFHTYKLDGQYLASYVTDIALSASSKAVYVGEGDTIETYYWFYYEAKLGKANSLLNSALTDENVDLKITKWNGAEYAPFAGTSFSELSSDIISSFVGSDIKDILNSGAFSDDCYITFSLVAPADLTPYLWQVALSVGVGIAAALVYLCIRFRPSRGLIAGVAVAASAFVSVTFFILTRISTLPVVALGCIPVVVAGLAMALFLLNAEKEIYRESKERDKNTAAFRLDCLEKANARQGGNILFYALLAFYPPVICLAFSPRIYGTVYIACVLGLAFATALTLTAVTPLSGVLGNAFSKIRLPQGNKKKKKAKGGQLLKKKSSAEPEESIFIGIND